MNVAPLMVNDGIVCIPFISGRVMLPDSMPFIANNIVSLGLSLLIVETVIFDAPTNFIGPCICAMIVVAVRTANKRVKIRFIKRVVIILFVYIIFLLVYLRGCTCLKCTSRAIGELLAWLVHLRQVRPI